MLKITEKSHDLVDEVAAHKRELQREQDEHDESEPSPGTSRQPVQAGPCEQPVGLPAQHIAYLNEHRDAEETRRCVEAAGAGARCVLLPGNIKDSEFCRRAVGATVKAFDKLDVLVNNAAFQEHAESLDDITDERLDETTQTNLFGCIRMARAA